MNLKFDKQFFCDFWAILVPYWRSEEKWPALLLAVSAALCSFGIARGLIAINSYQKEIIDVLQGFDKATIFATLMHLLFIVIILLLSAGYGFYFQNRLCLRWRRWLTREYVNQWLDNNNYYYMRFKDKIDNPDQRISEDLYQFPEKTLSIFFTLLQSLLTVASVALVLLYAGNLTVRFGHLNMVIPGYLLWGSLLYVLAGIWVTKWIGRKLSTLDYQHQRFDADFRFALIRLRENSEQIAFYKANNTENKSLDSLFAKIYQNSSLIITLKKNLMFFARGHIFATYLLGVLMALPLYLQKNIGLGDMMMISGAMIMFVSAVDVIINTFSTIAEWRAVIARLIEFNKIITKAQNSRANFNVIEHDQQDIIIHDLSLSLPSGQTLLQGIHLRFKPESAYLLKGSSGIGKSTFLRALAGLWPYAEGKIYIPKHKKLFFLPQKPYLPLGSLKDVLLYPHSHINDEDELHQLLEWCGLEKLKHQLNDSKDWMHELSPGEQQRIAFIRVFLAKPDIIVLDEATSALDEQAEAKVYFLLKRLLPEATIISVGHRASLEQYHGYIIDVGKFNNVNAFVQGFENHKKTLEVSI